MTPETTYNLTAILCFAIITYKASGMACRLSETMKWYKVRKRKQR